MKQKHYLSKPTFLRVKAKWPLLTMDQQFEVVLLIEKMLTANADVALAVKPSRKPSPAQQAALDALVRGL